MTKRIVQALVVFLTLAFLSVPAMAASETLDIFGTNASNAQTNMTKSGNQSVNVSAWNIGSGVKTFTINVTNTTDTFAITLHNITVGRLIEWRFNGSIANATQADSTGTIRFTQIQATGNRTYTLQPAVNYGGYNFTYGWFKEWIWINGVNLSSLLPAGGATVKTLINVTQNYTIGAANSTNTLFTCHANSGTLNVTLPTGVAGTEFTIKKKDATGNTCSVFSGQNIDGARYANISTQYSSIDVVYTSDEWSII